MGKLRQKLASNYMIHTLFSLKGNGRACIWTEPLWGIPYNLYVPYVALYMTAMGLTPADIGYVTSIGLVTQMIFSLFSGVLTDKLGRRLSTVIFDCMAWSVPEFLWMISQDFRWFAAAALFNGTCRVTENSWNLLLIEDLPQEQIMPAFSLTQMMGLIASFIAPLSKVAIDAFGFVPTMRVLYGINFVSMTTKFLLLYHLSSETQNGLRRMQAVKDVSIFRSLWECKDVYLRIIREKRMLLTLAIVAIYTLVSDINGNYWALYVCRELGFAEGNVVLLTTLKSLVTLACVFFVIPKVQKAPFKQSMLSAWGLFAAAQVVLLSIPKNRLMIPMLVMSAVLEAAALSILGPMTNSLLFINADPEERARVCGMVFATISLIVMVFPSLVGRAANLSIRYAFFISIALFAVEMILTLILNRLPEPLRAPE